MVDQYEKFYVGINVFVVRDGKLLLGKRKNVYGAGTWGLPGGHLEAGEGMKDAAARELREETGLQTKKLDFTNIVNDKKSRDQHYLQIGFIAEDIEGEPAIKEPDKCEEWKWFALHDLPKELLPAHIDQIQLFVDGSRFSDS